MFGLHQLAGVVVVEVEPLVRAGQGAFAGGDGDLGADRLVEVVVLGDLGDVGIAVDVAGGGGGLALGDTVVRPGRQRGGALLQRQCGDRARRSRCAG